MTLVHTPGRPPTYVLPPRYLRGVTKQVEASGSLCDGYASGGGGSGDGCYTLLWMAHSKGYTLSQYPWYPIGKLAPGSTFLWGSPTCL